MSIKVIYNSCYGGFSISRECAARMAFLGNREAQKLLDETEYFHGHLWETPRHDLILVQAVEELGSSASGSLSELKVHHLSGNRYIIEEYDGIETVIEPDDIAWIGVSSES